ncbi:hypothetical protein EA187_00275 [Lujinxingia sediminis]|uniref:Outer membrane protein beta-barrel domain-containing protein n=1 Tax=Lujinxingia sediminis TaxID=2480984 RepID=A0ABY0CVL3_9DELT|nr:hypothetical protein [Lujinxingia sediminis]RVU47907.1 hypothetical protein EA187_00275 [Lujinxingia sediminis]
MKIEQRKRASWQMLAAIMAWAAVMLMASVATAQGQRDDDEATRVTLIEVPGGGTARLIMELRDISGLDVRDADWFANQVRGRAFRIDGITERSSDMMWVMRGGSIAVVVNLVEYDAQEYRVQFITAESGTPEHQFPIDRSEEGLNRTGARMIRTELERFLGIGGAPVAQQAPKEAPQPAESTAPPAPSQPTQSAPAQNTESAPAQAAVAPVEDDLDPSDPEAMRRRAAAEEQALLDALSRNWLWVRGYGRMFRKDFMVAGQSAIFSYKSASFPGFELDVEAFPFGRTNPEMVAAGFYVNYSHGFDGLNILTEDETGVSEQAVSLQSMVLEGGAIYRLDSPLDNSNRQLRFKLGARYDSFSATENPILPSTSVISLVIGTRLVLPVIVEEFAVTAGVDVAPVSVFSKGAEVFGTDSFSYGFGTELGFVYEFMDNLFMSASYGFRITRSDFTGEGESEFAESDAFDMNQGLKVGVVYQY